MKADAGVAAVGDSVGVWLLVKHAPDAVFDHFPYGHCVQAVLSRLLYVIGPHAPQLT